MDSKLNVVWVIGMYVVSFRPLVSIQRSGEVTSGMLSGDDLMMLKPHDISQAHVLLVRVQSKYPIDHEKICDSQLRLFEESMVPNSIEARKYSLHSLPISRSLLVYANVYSRSCVPE